PAKVGIRFRYRAVEFGLYDSVGPESRRPVLHSQLSNRSQRGHRTSLGARHRWPAQHHRPSELGQDRHHLGHNLHGERKWRSRRRPNLLVKVTDRLDATSLPTGNDGSGWDHRLDVFATIRAAKNGEVFRGISFAPED